jgi:RNA polymerase sigma factor (sigma-70 family)
VLRNNPATDGAGTGEVFPIHACGACAVPSGTIGARREETCERLFLSQLDLIDAVIAFIVRRHHLNANDAEEFASLVRLKLLEDNYAVLRKFQERSSLRTYLTTVIQRLFLDYRIRAWGKWRPSAEAKRAGPLAMLLERLMMRDGLSFDEACSVIETNHRVTVGRRALEAMRERLPVRTRRRLVGEDAIGSSIPAEDQADRRVVEEEHAMSALRTRDALTRAIAQLGVQDRLIVQLRFEQALSVADVARALCLDQKALYRRLDSLLSTLRASLEREGLRGPEVLELLGRPEVDVEGVFRGTSPRNGEPRPSPVGRGFEKRLRKE